MAGETKPVYEYDSDQNFFCKNGVELTQSDVLDEFAALEAEVAAAWAERDAFVKSCDLTQAEVAALREHERDAHYYPFGRCTAPSCAAYRATLAAAGETEAQG